MRGEEAGKLAQSGTVDAPGCMFVWCNRVELGSQVPSGHAPEKD